jgi:hypothetical protein
MSSVFIVRLWTITCTCRPRLWIADWTIASVLSATAGDRPRTGDNERIWAARDGDGLLRAIVIGMSSNSSTASAVKDSSNLSPTLEYKNYDDRVSYFPWSLSHYRGSDLTSTTATIKRSLTNQMCLTYPINQSTSYPGSQSSLLPRLN